jgi:hypothetical protein
LVVGLVDALKRRRADGTALTGTLDDKQPVVDRPRLYQGLTVGYCLALSQFVMVLVLGIMYLRRADKVYDPLAPKAIERWTYLDTDAARAGHAEKRPVAATTSEVPSG